MLVRIFCFMFYITYMKKVCAFLCSDLYCIMEGTYFEEIIHCYISVWCKAVCQLLHKLCVRETF